MAITYRSVKGSPLTSDEMDTNFSDLEDGKVNNTGSETIAGVKTFTSDPIIPDEVYGAGWNGTLEPPTKNAVYDKIELLDAAKLNLSGGTMTGNLNMGSNDLINLTKVTNTGVTLLDFTTYRLYDSSGVASINWNGRSLHDSAGTNLLSWNTGLVAGTNLNMSSNNITSIGSLTNGSSTIQYSGTTLLIDSAASLVIGTGVGNASITIGHSASVTSLEGSTVSVTSADISLGKAAAIVSVRGDLKLLDKTDATKVLTHNVASITTATTRTVTWQDKDITVAGLDDVVFVTPEQYGAVGDGVADDSAAFLAIPSSAKYIVLRPGATYLINSSCLNSLVKSGCIVEGNFATIKRSDAVVTTLTVAAASGVTSITVDDATGFFVGDYITITDSTGTYGGTGDQENSNRGGDLDTIESIVGNVITITNGSVSGLRLPESGNLDIAGEYPIGSNVIRTFNMWSLGNANNNIEWRNVIIDGNVSGNGYTYDWRVNNTGACKGTNIKFIGCQFKNTPSENITVSGQVWFDQCYVENLAGGIAHGSNANPTQIKNGIWVTNCKGKNVGQHAVEAGHSEGFVTFSASVREVWILNNDIENELSGGNKTNTGFCFGKVSWESTTGDEYQDGKVYVLGNRFVNFENIFNVAGNTGTVQNQQDIYLSNNEFENCGDILVRGASLRTGAAVRNIKILGNKITNGRLFFEEVFNLEISSNTIKQEEDYSFPSDIIGLSNVNTVGHVYVAGSRVKITGNKVIGKTTNDDYCKRGIFFLSNVAAKDSGGTDTNYGYYQDIDVSNNTVRNHHEWEIATSNVATSTARSLELVGWSVKNNHVFAQKDSTTQELLRIDPGVTAKDNKVYTFLSGQIGIRAFGINSSGPITSCKGAIVRGNEIYGSATSPIILQGNNNDYNNVITGNILQVELADSGSGKSFISDNILLLSTMGTPYIVNEDEDTGVY